MKKLGNPIFIVNALISFLIATLEVEDPGTLSRMRVRHRKIYGGMEEMMREEYGT